MMMNKKGDISIGMIITAAIALIVLVVVIAIFAGYFTGWQQSIGNESSYVARCTQVKNSDGTTATWRPACLENEDRVTVVSDASENPGQVCCLPQSKA